MVGKPRNPGLATRRQKMGQLEVQKREKKEKKFQFISGPFHRGCLASVDVGSLMEYVCFLLVSNIFWTMGTQVMTFYLEWMEDF